MGARNDEEGGGDVAAIRDCESKYVSPWLDQLGRCEGHTCSYTPFILEVEGVLLGRDLLDGKDICESRRRHDGHNESKPITSN